MMVAYTKVSGGGPIWVDPSYIVVVKPYTEDWTEIILRNGDRHEVREPTEQVLIDVKIAKERL